MNKPYAWIGVERDEKGLNIAQFNEYTGKTARASMTGDKLWLKADCDFLTETAQFSYSLDGKRFLPLGEPFEMVYQLTTFQGIRYSLFAYNGAGRNGGYADFDSITVTEPHPRGLMRPIPYGKQILLTSFHANTGHANTGRANTGLAVQSTALASGTPTAFTVIDMKLGRVALKSGRAYVSVDRDGRAKLEIANPGLEQSFQWMETPTGELALMSLASSRYLRIDPKTQAIMCDSAGPAPDGSDGARFVWTLATK